ncbi:MAG: PfkB family carbohydrate kinase [Spirochaetes bacterium]|nr:PfkB family carbohydrate kinase [Spirochaetota bacterium]
MRDFDRRRLRELTDAFGSLRVAVLGDFFLDKYIEVDPSLAEISLETGRIAHQAVAVRHSPGAAGTVVNNLAALGTGTLLALGFSGDDGEGYELRKDLSMLGVDIVHLHTDSGRRTPTYMKPRDIDRPGLDGEHSRYDMKNRTSTPPAIEEILIDSLDEVLGRIDVLVVMDQVEAEGCGAVTHRIVNALAGRLPRFPDLIAWADSRRRIMSFRGLMLKMNQFEMAGVHDPLPGALIPDETIAAGLPSLEAKIGAGVFVTVADRGVWVGGTHPVLIPALRIDGPVDPTGAGDSFTAGTVLALAAGASPAEAALAGNLVASVTVRQLGTTGSARPEGLFAALDLWKEQNP